MAFVHKVFLLALVCGLVAMVTSQDEENQVLYHLEDAMNQTELATQFMDQIKDFFLNSRDMFLVALSNMSHYLPLSVQYAVEVGRECDIVEYNKHYYTKAGLIIAGILVVIGIVFCFFGYRLMKIVLFMIGFVIGGALTYFIILAFLQHRGETWVPWVAGSASVVVGIICGVLTICIYYIGIFLAGGSIGFLIAWFILAAINIPFFRTHIYVPILASVTLAIVVGIIALIIQKWFFMFGTALLGGFKIAWGVDYYLELGSMVYYLLLFAEHRAELNPCWYSWCMIGFFVIVVIVGFIIQAALTGRKYDHKKDLRGVCCGLCKKKKKTKKSNDDGGKYMDLKNLKENED